MNADATTGPEGSLLASELAASQTVRDLAASTAWYHD